MASKATTDGGRTGTNRFEETLDADELIEGDRIAPKLVASNLDQLGEPIKHSRQGRAPEPKTQLFRITEINRLENVHSALLADPETGIIVRATRMDNNSAWTQQEADWKVRGIGAETVVEEVKELEVPEKEQVDDAEKYVQDWVDVVIRDPANGYDDYRDSTSLAGSGAATLEVSDVNGRKAIASISLED